MSNHQIQRCGDSVVSVMVGFNNDGFMPNIVKSCKELLILSLILEQPMSGIGLIKQIYAKTGVFLSQGTVYPILYTFEDMGILASRYEKGSVKTKLYHIAPEKRETVRDIIDYSIRNFYLFIHLISPELAHSGSRKSRCVRWTSARATPNISNINAKLKMVQAQQ